MITVEDVREINKALAKRAWIQRKKAHMAFFMETTSVAAICTASPMTYKAINNVLQISKAIMDYIFQQEDANAARNAQTGGVDNG